VKTPDRPQPYPHPARLILILSLAPTVGLGIGRFAYALVLPDMRDALLWSYSAAGFMNTINAAGYLVGALFASQLIKRFGLAAAVRWGTLACVLSLALCAISGNFFVLSFARLLAGLGAAAGFVGGQFFAQLVLRRTRYRHSRLRADCAVRAAGFWPRLVVDRVVGDDVARNRNDHPRAARPVRWRQQF
jgi:predicted MFS family arabinose efflux permease